MSLNNQGVEIIYVEEEAAVADLTPGYIGEDCRFEFKTFQQRPEWQQHDYNRLVLSIFHYGIQRPLITWRDFEGHFVLIGQRRWEIAKRMGIEKVKVWRIESPSPCFWNSENIDQLNALKSKCGETEY